MQQNLKFDSVYISPRVRVALASVLASKYANKFWEILDKLRLGQFTIPGLRIERLHTNKGKVFSARLNIELRIIFSMYTESSKGQRSLVIWDVNHHDAAYDRVDRQVVPTMFHSASPFLEPLHLDNSPNNTNTIEQTQLGEQLQDAAELIPGLVLFRLPRYVLDQPQQYSRFAKDIDRYLRLSEDQEELLSQTNRAYLVRGAAGTGKTALALFHALNIFEKHPHDDIYFFTYQDELACVCRCYKENLVEQAHEHAGEFSVFSYLNFCKHYLKRYLDKSANSYRWQWIDRSTSIKHLREIINTRSRWVRSFHPEDLYSYIYSILKGRFVPGTDQLPASSADFARIFKGYGNVPENLDDILEIFDHYEERLKRWQQKDEADLIRHCYQSLKERAILTETDRAVWIVIDEIQDFTELEWKSILLFWENQCLRTSNEPSYPFLCGDRNQNISRSGFRWQEVDSYIQSTLRKIRRPNALQKVHLHQNFRNSKPIHELAAFVHSLATDTSADHGIATAMPGDKPTLLVGTTAEFLNFLQQTEQSVDERSSTPLIILSEDSTAIASWQGKVVNDENLFFMATPISKGLEFEDIIAYRLFSTLADCQPEQWQHESFRRTFDLWYMTITRARQNLLIYLTTEDLTRLRQLLGQHYDDFLNLVHYKNTDVQSALMEFYQKRDRYLPNYAVVFLERTKANESWKQYQQLVQKNEAEHAAATALKDKAFRLWKRCRDYASIGRAYVESQQYEEAIPYLEKSSLFGELACCYEKIGHYERAALSFKQEGALLDAARCFEKAQLYADAALIYEEHQEWLQAANNYNLVNNSLSAANCYERANMCQQAAELYRQQEQWLQAADQYHQSGSHELAGDMYLKGKNKPAAADAYATAGLNAKAAAIYESLMYWHQAAACYEQCRNFEKAAALFTKAGRLKDAARTKESCGDLENAARDYERLQRWEEAAHIWQKLSQPNDTARCYENSGALEQAAGIYTAIGLHNEAGHCYEKNQNWGKAADSYRHCENFSAAASMLARLGHRREAAEFYLLAGQTKVAIQVASPPNKNESDYRSYLVEWARKSQRLDLAAAVQEALGQYKSAAALYKQCMMLARAAQCAQEGKEFKLAGQYFMQAGNLEQAARCFIDGKDLRNAAQCYELLKKWPEARAIYQKLHDAQGVQRCDAAANWL